MSRFAASFFELLEFPEALDVVEIAQVPYPPGVRLRSRRRALSRSAANCSGRFEGLLASIWKSRLGGESWSFTIRPPYSNLRGRRGGAGNRPLGTGRSGEPQPHHLRRERHDLVLRHRTRGGPERPQGAGDPVLHEPHVPPLALLVGLAAADGDEDPVAVGRVGDVGPAEGAHLAPAHPGHEEEPRNHGVEAAVLEGDLVGLDAAAATLRPVAGREP